MNLRPPQATAAAPLRLFSADSRFPPAAEHRHPCLCGKEVSAGL